jgi:hypothetical protein
LRLSHGNEQQTETEGDSRAKQLFIWGKHCDLLARQNGETLTQAEKSII